MPDGLLTRECQIVSTVRRRLGPGLSGKPLTVDFSHVRDVAVLGRLVDLSARLLTDLSAADQFTSLILAERGQP